MQESRKYSNELTEEEIQLLGSAVANIALKLNNIFIGTKTPKEYSKELLKQIKHRKNLAGIFSLYKLELDPNSSLTPDEFDKLLWENFLKVPQTDPGDMMADSELSDDTFYLRSNRRSEVLKVLSDNGLLSHSEHKEKMTEYHGNKKKRLAGRPSTYKDSDDKGKMKKLLADPYALELIIKCLDESMVLYNALKYLAIAFFYFLNLVEESELYNAFKSASKEKPEEIRRATINSLSCIKPVLAKLSDVEIERFAEEALGNSMRTILEDKSNFLPRLFLLLGFSSRYSGKTVS